MWPAAVCFLFQPRNFARRSACLDLTLSHPHPQPFHISHFTFFPSFSMPSSNHSKSISTLISSVYSAIATSNLKPQTSNLKPQTSNLKLLGCASRQNRVHLAAKRHISRHILRTHFYASAYLYPAFHLPTPQYLIISLRPFYKTSTYFQSRRWLVLPTKRLLWFDYKHLSPPMNQRC